MPDLPERVEIAEEGPREGFQIEPGPIPTADKVALIDALADTGLRHIQICSFVNPRLVPGWADAEAVAGSFSPREGVHYTALWFNESGLSRALAFRDRLHLFGSISLSASDAFSRKNLNRGHAENLEAMRKQTAAHQAAGVPVTRLGVTKFDSTVGGLGGCPFAGQKGAAGNICTEELALLCEEMGIATGIDLDALIEVGRMAERIVGHPLPSELLRAGSLDAFRRKAA